jgi:hypothetical protein
VTQRSFTGLESGFAGMLPWIGAGLGAGVGGYVSDGMALRFGYRWGYRLVPMGIAAAGGAVADHGHHRGDSVRGRARVTWPRSSRIELNEGRLLWAATASYALL